MITWQTELSEYLQRLDMLRSEIGEQPCWPSNIPELPLDTRPSRIQCIIHRVATFYAWGAWARTRESIDALILLWREGHLATGAIIARLLFEIWGSSRCMSDALSSFLESRNIEKLGKKANRMFEGVRSEVLMPWGEPAAEKPIHVLAAIRALKPDFPRAMEVYDDLSESAHANQPRFTEWWFLGKSGDNWANETVQKRGHELLNKTVSAIEAAVAGIETEVKNGLTICGDIY